MARQQCVTGGASLTSNPRGSQLSLSHFNSPAAAPRRCPLLPQATGYGTEMNERKWLQRMIYLESVAGVPGMVAGKA